MSRRVLVMLVAAGVVVAAAIALAIMTRSEPAPLKSKPNVASVISEQPIATQSTSTSTPAQNSNTPPPPAIASESGGSDVAEPGNGSAGAALERLADEYAQHHWANAIAECLNPEVAIAGAKQCAVSACELHDTVHARRFFSRVAGGDRDEVRDECERVHIPIDRPLRPLLGTHRRPFRSPIVSPAGSGG
jgi:hypothetical protein